MIRKFAVLILVAVLLLALPGAAQDPVPNSFSTKQLRFPVQFAPQGVTAGSVSQVGATGATSYYYWVIANYATASSSPLSYFVTSRSNGTLTGGNYNHVSWSPVTGAASYDLLRTTTRTPPVGNCACAVATGISGTTQDDQANALNGYTVALFNPNALAVTLDNRGTANAGESHLFMTQNGIAVADLSTGTRTLTATSNESCLVTPNGGQMCTGYNSELVTLSTISVTTDTVGNLLPANAVIQSVTGRVTTTITTSANYIIGDAAIATNRFLTTNTSLTATNTWVGLNCWATAGNCTQATAAPVRITTNANAGAGAMRVTVHYVRFIPPTS